jgi:adenylate cyclase
MGDDGGSLDAEAKALIWRVGIRQGAAVGVANLVGATFVFVYTDVLLRPVDRDVGHHVSTAVEVMIFVAYLAVTVAVASVRMYRQFRVRTDWICEANPDPTDDEREQVLRLPLDVTRFNLLPWLGAAIFFSLLNVSVGETAAHIGHVGMTIVLGGLVTSALSFLLMERAMRPVFAVALGGQANPRHVTLGVRNRLLLTWVLGSAVPLYGIAMLAFRKHFEEAGPAVFSLAAAGMAAGLVATVVAAKTVADPLAEVRRALTRVEEGDLDVHVPVDDGGEVGRLQAGVNQMVDGLRERHRLADLFGRHVGTEVARRALVEGAGLDSEQREASALFVDIVGSTAMAEVLPPHEVVRTLNAFFGAVVAAVTAEGGWVNKFEGDGALCVFGAPATQPDHAARALRAARDLRARIERLSAAHPGLDAAVGVSSGSVVAGNVGTEARYEYTIIGRPVNEAARLSELAKSRDGRVLASAGALDRAGDEAHRWAGLGSVALRGQQAPTAIYEPEDLVQAPTRGVA